MADHSPRDPNFEAVIRDSFARQSFMALLGAELETVKPGRVSIGLRTREDLLQQHGFVHAGVTGAIADSAGGYAALTLCPAGTSVLSVEYKMNLLAPARGDRLIAEGRVVRSGRTITATQIDVYAIEAEERVHIAMMLQTIIALAESKSRPGG